MPANVTDGIAIPPKVEIDLPDASRAAGKPFTVLVVVTDQGGGIDQVRLYHNGKSVQPGSLMQQREVEAKGQRIRVVAFQVKPVPGINTFRGVATGLWGIEGESNRVTETFTGDGPLPKLHVVAVGINKYSDPKLTLGYSVPDAKAIVDELQRSAKGAFSDVDLHALYDGDATRANIIGALKGLSGVDENDVVVVYLAGHGTVVGDDWIFLPHEATMQKKFEDYRKGAITAHEIQDALVAAQAQRVLVMIDSCQSGATVETFERQQNFERRYIRNFSRVAGVTVIAAVAPRSGGDRAAVARPRPLHLCRAQGPRRRCRRRAARRQRHRARDRAVCRSADPRHVQALPERAAGAHGVRARRRLLAAGQVAAASAAAKTSANALLRALSSSAIETRMPRSWSDVTPKREPGPDSIPQGTMPVKCSRSGSRLMAMPW